jgi:hypothetical protein
LTYQKYQKNLIFALILAIVIGIALLYIGNLNLIDAQVHGENFFANWVGTRTFLVNGFSPYTQESMFQIRQQAALTDLSFTFEHWSAAEPIYGLLAYFPFILIKSYPHAFAAWLVFNEILLIFIFWMLYRVVDWKGSIVVFIFAALAAVFWKSMLDVLLSGSNAILILFAITAVLYTLKHDMQELAGVLLAIASIKIQLLWIPIIFLLIYSNIQRKNKTIIWFFVSIVLVSVSMMLLDPGWVTEYIMSLLKEIFGNTNSIVHGTSIAKFFNDQYFSTFSEGLGTVFLSFGVRLGNVFTALMVMLLFTESISIGRRDFKGNLWQFSLAVVLSTWVGINYKFELFIFYLPVFFLFLSLIHDRWKAKGNLLYWLAPIILLLVNWGVFRNGMDSILLVFGLYPFLFFVMLYWIRWWAISRNYLVYER